MKISFIVPLYNCLPLTQAMLASLRATVPSALEHEVVFVDDGSTDGTREWLKGLPAPCRAVLNEKNLGFAGACNRGAAAARGEFLFFLNNDLILLPGWLEPMLAVFAAHADAGLVGNVQRNAATGAVDHAGLVFNAKGKPEHLTRRSLAAVRPVVAVTGACVAIRAATWRKLGGFDEGFINGCEDVDLGLRALESGLQKLRRPAQRRPPSHQRVGRPETARRTEHRPPAAPLANLHPHRRPPRLRPGLPGRRLGGSAQLRGPDAGARVPVLHRPPVAGGDAAHPCGGGGGARP